MSTRISNETVVQRLNEQIAKSELTRAAVLSLQGGTSLLDMKIEEFLPPCHTFRTVALRVFSRQNIKTLGELLALTANDIWMLGGGGSSYRGLRDKGIDYLRNALKPYGLHLEDEW